MLKKKEYRVCDRCSKEIDENNGHINFCDVVDCYFYDLCDDCYEEYTKYQAEADDLRKRHEELAKHYKFGKYLPKEEENERLD